ncbi:MAG TPA: TonB-dependent receptor [Steroidobacteraceae bacterium]|nr:TonB-dependent receptor [Steroidobacteraceae bacterium]
MTVNRAFRFRLWDLIAIAPLLIGVVAAYAQETPKETTKAEELKEIVITGSRIARPELDRLEPTVVVGSESFDQRGYTDVGQALAELPGFGIQSSSAVNTQGTFGIAQSFVDLYSLGSQRTLVLVDGRRFVSSNTTSLFAGASPPGQQVDLNVVPTKLIDRVETISVGGAPIYGADAIAGTVNIIMKKNYEGLDVDGQVGVSDDKDAWNYRARVLAGFNFADDRGNVTAVAEFSKANGLVGNDRKNFSENLGFLAPATAGPFQTVLTPNLAVNSLSTGGVPYLDDFFYLPPALLPPAAIGVTDASGNPLAFSGGHLTPYSLGTATGNPIFFSGGDGIRLSQFSNLLSPIERINIDTIDNFKISDHVKLFAETWFSETHGKNLIAQPAYNTTLFGPAGTLNGDFKVSINNPFLSLADRTLIANELAAYGAANCPAGPGPTCATFDPNWSPNFFYIGRANTDLQSGAATGNQQVYRGVLGLSGDFSLGATHDYTWELSANYGHSQNTSVQPAYVFQNLQNALNATTVGGQIVCAPGYVNSPVATNSSTCAPLNVFGVGEPSAAAVAYITHMATAVSTDTQRDATANLSGDIVRLPGGEWKGAIGFENRREAGEFAPDSFFTSNAGQLVASAVAGSYVTNEVYAETLVPVFGASQDIPLLHQLEFEGAFRRVDNTISGKSNTYTEGLRWAPVQDVLFRGNRTISIRAPAVTELFLPSSTSFEFANDPCDKNFVNQGLVPATRLANCKAALAGIPGGYNPATFTSNVVNATAQGMTSGNPGLSPEKADSYTYGVVLRPRWTPRLSLSADWYDIKMSNAIVQLNLVELMDECYDSTDFPNNPACSHFTRNAAGQVAGYTDGFINAGLLHFQGFSAGLDAAFDLPYSMGMMKFRARYLDTKTLVLQVGSAAPINEAGALTSTLAEPKSKAVLELTYDKGPFEWYWQGQYVSMMNFSNQNTPTSQDILSVPGWWLLNSSISLDVTKALQLRLTVDNVFDKEPPYPALAAGTGGNFASATSLYFAGIIGRTYLLTADYRF